MVQLIRGKAGSKVKLEIIPETEDFSERKFVTITRRSEIEEQAAKSRVIEIKEIANNKGSIIDLPAFYIDFNAWRNRDPNYKVAPKMLKQY